MLVMRKLNVLAGSKLNFDHEFLVSKTPGISSSKNLFVLGKEC